MRSRSRRPAAEVPGPAEEAGPLAPRTEGRRAETERRGEGKPVHGRTRVSAAFIGVVAAVVVLALLLLFILENTASVKISYFGASGHMAIGVALLLAAIGGALLVGILGMARILQLRVRVGRARRRHGL